MNRGLSQKEERRRQAAFHEMHIDDPEYLGVPLPERAERGSEGSKGTMMTVRFPADEAELIRRLSRETGQSYSEVIREAVRRFARPQLEIHGSGNHSVVFDAGIATRGASVQAEPEQPPRARTGSSARG